MIEQYTRTALEQQQWLIVDDDISPGPDKATLIKLWKMYANGVALTLSIDDEEGQFLVYADVGHAATGSNRIEYGRFSAVKAALDRLIEECNQWDSAWET